MDLFIMTIWFAFANGQVGVTSYVVRNECNRELAIQYALEKLPLSIPPDHPIQDPHKFLVHDCQPFPASPGPGEPFEFPPMDAEPASIPGDRKA